MARRKRPVLYEVVRRAQTAREAGWRRRLTGLLREPQRQAGDPLLRVRAVQAEPGSDEAAGAAPPRRWHVEFGWPGAVIGASAALVMLTVAFMLGRVTGGGGAGESSANIPFFEQDAGDGHASGAGAATPAGAGAVDVLVPGRPAARRVESPARSDKVAGGAPPRGGENRDAAGQAAGGSAPQPGTIGAGEDTSIPVPQLTTQKGMHYIVVQHFRRKELEAALAAVEFLRANGIECGIQVRGDVRVVAAEPFALGAKDRATREREQKRCEQLRQRIRQLGREYAREHGYAFDQCYTQEY